MFSQVGLDQQFEDTGTCFMLDIETPSPFILGRGGWWEAEDKVIGYLPDPMRIIK